MFFAKKSRSALFCRFISFWPQSNFDPEFNIKTMKTSLLKLGFILLVVPVSVHAQDTIGFRNNTIVSAKISEVGVTEIKYKRFDNLEGPHYSVFKTEVAFIKYANGFIDSIKLSTPVANTILLVKDNELTYKRNRVLYKGRGINDRKLKSLINTCDVPEKQVKLKNELKTLCSYELNRKLLAPGLFVSGAAVHFYGLNRVFGNQGSGFETKGDNNLTTVFIVGAALRITAHVINMVYKNKAMSKREQIVDIYNQ